MGYLCCYGVLDRCASRIIMMPAVDRQSWKALKLGSSLKRNSGHDGGKAEVDI